MLVTTACSQSAGCLFAGSNTAAVLVQLHRTVWERCSKHVEESFGCSVYTLASIASEARFASAEEAATTRPAGSSTQARIRMAHLERSIKSPILFFRKHKILQNWVNTGHTNYLVTNATFDLVSCRIEASVYGTHLQKLPLIKVLLEINN